MQTIKAVLTSQTYDLDDFAAAQEFYHSKGWTDGLPVEPPTEAAMVCSADIARVNMDHKSFTFMRSYPNNIPLSEKAVQRIGAVLAPFQFDRVYSHFFDLVMPAGAKRTPHASIERCVAAIGGAYYGA